LGCYRGHRKDAHRRYLYLSKRRPPRGQRRPHIPAPDCFDHFVQGPPSGSGDPASLARSLVGAADRGSVGPADYESAPSRTCRSRKSGIGPDPATWWPFVMTTTNGCPARSKSRLSSCVTARTSTGSGQPSGSIAVVEEPLVPSMGAECDGCRMPEANSSPPPTWQLSSSRQPVTNWTRGPVTGATQGSYVSNRFAADLTAWQLCRYDNERRLSRYDNARQRKTS
jgi:hypothetical protein